MVVRGDEAGHDDRACAIDHFGVWCGDLRPHVGDPRAVDENIGAFEITHLRVEREHDAAAKQDAALPSVADQPLRLRWRRSARASDLAGTTRRGSESRRGGRRQKLSPASP